MGLTKEKKNRPCEKTLNPAKTPKSEHPQNGVGNDQLMFACK